MDNTHFPIEHRKPGLQNVKLEILEGDGENLHLQEGEQGQVYIKEEIKIEETELHLGTSQSTCNICDGMFMDEFSLKYHINECKVKSTQSPTNTIGQDEIESCEKKFKCPHAGCNKSYRRKHHLGDHLKSHTGERPYKCRANGCTKSFIKKRNLTLHEVVHKEERLFKCPESKCTAAFKRKIGLQSHKERVHSNEKLIRCQETETIKWFRQDADSTWHEMVHSDKKIFKCPHTKCTSAFKTKDVLRLHMKVHSAEKPFKCNIIGCTKSYKRKNDFKQHVRMHSDEKRFKCEHPGCSKMFKVKSNLGRHMAVHSDNKPFKCEHPGCANTYKRKIDLNEHIVVHVDERPFKCEHVGCKKWFKTKKKLHVHMRTHKCDGKLNKASKTISANTPRNKNKTCRESLQEDGRYEDQSGCYQKQEESFEQSVETCDEVKTVQQDFSCEESSSNENKLQANVHCPGKYSTFEFVEVDQIGTDKVIVDVKLEFENKEK